MHCTTISFSFSVKFLVPSRQSFISLGFNVSVNEADLDMQCPILRRYAVSVLKFDTLVNLLNSDYIFSTS